MAIIGRIYTRRRKFSFSKIFFIRPIFMLIPKMESKIWLDSIKWSKNCHFWFFRQNDENPNFWLWIVKAQKRKGFISYQYYFFHIQSICYNMTYMVFVRFDLREVLMWAHFKYLIKLKFILKIINNFYFVNRLNVLLR